MLAVHPGGHPICAQVTLAGLTVRWRLAAQNRGEAAAHVKPAVEARGRVREAARDWRECLSGAPEEKAAARELGAAQRQYLQVLREVGADQAGDWEELAKVVLEPPWDADEQRKPRRSTSGGAKKKCLRLMMAAARKNPDAPPLPHREYANRMRKQIPKLKHREFDECWARVLAVLGVKWAGKGGRPKSAP
jgi:hypothetical protein